MTAVAIGTEIGKEGRERKEANSSAVSMEEALKQARFTDPKSEG